MPAVNRQEPDIHPAVSSRAVHLPDGNDFGTGTFTTALAPNALTATETIESLIMLPPDSEVAIHVNPVKWQVEVFLGTPFSSLPSDARTFLLPDTPGAIALNDPHEIRAEFNRGNITAAFLDAVSLAPKARQS